MSGKPNIIYIFSDQHRGDTLGAVGHPTVITPHLDRLAAGSVMFDHCYTSAPLCMPARASMMTGQTVSEHGVWSNNVSAPASGPSHVRNVRDAGYHTALFGKTHLYVHGENQGTHAREREGLLRQWGFEHVHELHGPLASSHHDSYYTDYLADKGLLEKHRAYVEEYLKGWTTGTAKPWEEPACPLPNEDHLDAYCGRAAAEWIKEYDKDQPFYLQVLFPGPHDPFDSPQDYRDMYDEDKMPIGIMDQPREPVPSYVKRVLAWSNLGKMTYRQKQRLRVYYYAKITLIDEYIGRIVAALEQKGLAENTWIIYSADHGEMLGDHRLSHKIVFYEAAINIPLIIRPPRGVEGWSSPALCDTLDVTQTILDIAGARPLYPENGVSLKPKVEAGPGAPNAGTHKPEVFSEVGAFTMVRDERYKLAMNAITRRPLEMYDLRNDPRELHNLVKDPLYSGVRQQLLGEKLTPFVEKRLDKEKFADFLDASEQTRKLRERLGWMKALQSLD